jgi:hypothetical protein
MTVRAKFHCSSVEDFTPKAAGAAAGLRVFRFAAQYDDSIPEDQRYAKYTPSGELRITVDNPNVDFEVGKAYYLDFTPVEDTPKE